MHSNNIFLTLTYSDEHLKSPKLHYPDFQDFMKGLRYEAYKTYNGPISVMVTGEYGELTKRPHWHAIIFNYSPPDLKSLRTSDRGDRIFKSSLIDSIWGKNDPEKKPNEIGGVTLDSAGYVARYAAKKLVHGFDQEHEFHPIHKTSSKNAIGKAWIKKYHPHTFAHGFITLPNGSRAKIPRYYEDWYKKHHPEKWLHYVTQLKPTIQANAELKSTSETNYYLNAIDTRGNNPYPLTRSKVKLIILESKFEQLQQRLKLK